MIATHSPYFWFIVVLEAHASDLPIFKNSTTKLNPVINNRYPFNLVFDKVGVDDGACGQDDQTFSVSFITPP